MSRRPTHDLPMQPRRSSKVSDRPPSATVPGSAPESNTRQPPPPEIRFSCLFLRVCGPTLNYSLGGERRQYWGQSAGHLVICRGLKLLRSAPHRHQSGERRPAAPSPIARARAPFSFRTLRCLRAEAHSAVQPLKWPKGCLLGPTTHRRQAHQSAGGKLFSQPRPPLAPHRSPAPIPGPISVSPWERRYTGRGHCRAVVCPMQATLCCDEQLEQA
ncbi:hypothetical protein NDU88_004910 [Pleurodeles waltl]|uniref:Uncharacterized protein n=1 Tax=Pleurodeles waltl TaxID=8319 RepID=A0AAV7PDY0_PLEWA|nr:hypothetical protein NDU88_004910 [Pleurodeles waltl]